MSAYYATGGPAQSDVTASDLSADFARLGSATSASKYAGMASSFGVEQAGEQFDVDYDYLMRALRS